MLLIIFFFWFIFYLIFGNLNWLIILVKWLNSIILRNGLKVVLKTVIILLFNIYRLLIFLLIFVLHFILFLRVNGISFMVHFILRWIYSHYFFAYTVKLCINEFLFDIWTLIFWSSLVYFNYLFFYHFY